MSNELDAVFIGSIAFFHIFWYFSQIIWKLVGSEVENYVEHIHMQVYLHMWWCPHELSCLPVKDCDL